MTATEISGSTREVLDAISRGVLVCDPTTARIVDANEEFLELTGYDQDVLRGRELNEVVAKTDWEENRDVLQRAVVADDPVQVVWELRGYDAARIEVELEISVTGEGEDELAIATVTRLLDDGRPLRSDGEPGLQFYANLIDAAPVALWVQGYETVVFANDHAANFYGVDAPEDLVGRSMVDFVYDEDKENLLDRCERVLTEREKMSALEGKIRDANGKTRYALFAAAPIAGEDMMLVVARDITDQKEYEQVLERRTRQLELLNRIVRHDIRNDMQLVLANSHMLREHVDDEGHDRLEQLLERSQHVVELTEVVGDLMEVMVDESSPSLEPIRLADVLEQQVTEVAADYDDATVEVEGDLPSVSVAANDMLSNLFRNVIDNGVQHNDTSSPTVTVSAERVGDSVVVSVADDGPGVPDAQKQAIFGKGEKGLESSGVGLGLYLVKELAELFDGDVWVEDRDPTGAVFKIKLQTAE